MVYSSTFIAFIIVSDIFNGRDERIVFGFIERIIHSFFYHPLLDVSVLFGFQSRIGITVFSCYSYRSSIVIVLESISFIATRV